MIRASTILASIPNLPSHSKEVLGLLIAKAGDPEIHIPGMPTLPNFAGEVPQVVKDAIVAVLGRFTFTFYQVVGVQVALDGQQLGGMGGRVSETLNVKNPVPVLRVTPIFELGSVGNDFVHKVG